MLQNQWIENIARALLVLVLFPEMAMAEEVTLNEGNTAWILTSTALVLFMSLPGLALFYGDNCIIWNYK